MMGYDAGQGPDQFIFIQAQSGIKVQDGKKRPIHLGAFHFHGRTRRNGSASAHHSFRKGQMRMHTVVGAEAHIQISLDILDADYIEFRVWLLGKAQFIPFFVRQAHVGHV